MANPSQPVDTNNSNNRVTENSPGGTAVGVTAFATDPNGLTITYSLLDDAGGLFAIDPTTGVVTVVGGAAIDYETRTSHNILVQASNGVGTSSQSFTINVVNVLGVIIQGLSDGDIVDATHTIVRNPFPTNEEDLIDGHQLNDTLFGLGGNDTLIGGNHHDILDGGVGADSMVGDTGNDTFFVDNVGDVVLELSGRGSGIDTVNTTLNTYTLPANVENLNFIGVGNFSGTGNGLSNLLTGGTGNDTLDGGAGDDTLVGGTGADSMIGGLGNDTYIVDDAGDSVSEGAAGGADTIKTTLNAFSLGPLVNVENLKFTGAGDFTGIGNGLNNALTGGSGNDTLDSGAGKDTLDGGTGADSMTGGMGNDIYVVDNAGDTVTEGAGAGTDTVKTTLANYTLADNFEILTFTGVGNFAGNGNTLANTITGGTGNDTIDGSSGNDQLLGGVGDDQLLGGIGLDVLIGGAGADSLTGGAGADKFTFKAISDFAAGPLFDTILDFNHAEIDKIDVSAINGDASVAKSAFTFIGAAAFSNVAGQLHYVVNGGGGVNVEGDTNADGVADFHLVVNGVASLVATDFVL